MVVTRKTFPDLKPVQQRGLTPPYLCRLLHRFSPRSHGSGAPFIQKPSRREWQRVGPEEPKLALKEVMSGRSQIVLERNCELGLLPVSFSGRLSTNPRVYEQDSVISFITLSDSSSFPTDAKIDATYNRTPFEPKPWASVDKANPTFYN
jgi:hypothetical protein